MDNTQNELLKRYKYLNENKELILASCIVYGIDKENIKKKIKKLKRLKTTNKNLAQFIDKMLTSYKTDLKSPKAYLSSYSPSWYTNMLEELLLGDLELEDTKIYHRINTIKENEILFYQFKNMVNDLEQRRKKNQHLKRIPTFTVWKILSYVRNKYKNNKVVLSALDKYYNLDRYTIAQDDCMYGYYIEENIEKVSHNYPNSTLYGNSHDSCVSFSYQGNKYEKEDDYFDYSDGTSLDDDFYPTQFAYDLANCEMVKNKEKVLKEYLEKVKALTNN